MSLESAAAQVEDAPVVFGALRFVLAALPLLPWLWKSSSPESARSSAVVGSLGAVAYAAVFVSFSYGTTGAKAAFITALQTTVVAWPWPTQSSHACSGRRGEG